MSKQNPQRILKQKNQIKAEPSEDTVSQDTEDPKVSQDTEES